MFLKLRFLLPFLLLCLGLTTTCFAQQVSTLTVSPNPITGGKTATGTVTLSQAAKTGGFQVTLSSSSITVATTPASVKVAAGEKIATFTVTALPVRSTGTTTITATDAAKHTAKVVVTVDVPAVRVSGLAISPSTITIPGGATGKVTLSSKAGTGGLKVSLSSNQSYLTVPASVTVPAGDTYANFAVSTKPVKSGGTAVVSARDSDQYSASASVTVKGPIHLESVSISPSPITAGDGATGTILLSGTAPSGGLTIKLQSNKTFLTVPASVAVSSGKDSATFKITTKAVTSVGPATVTATDPYAYTALANVTVNLPPVRLHSVTVSPSTIVAANSATGTVTLTENAGSGGVVVNLSSNQSFLVVPSSVTVQAGSNSAIFIAATRPVSTAGPVTITGTDPHGFEATAAVTVNVPSVRLLSMSFSPSSVVGPGYVTGTVSLSANAPSNGFTVTLSTMQTFVTVPMTVTVPGGSSSVNFTANAVAVSANSSATISGVDANGYAAKGSFQVTPPTGTIIQMTNTAQYSPVSLTVPAGTVVTWANVSFMSHTVTGDVVSQGLSSGSIVPQTSFSWTVPSNAPSGTAFYYHCTYHGAAGNGKSLGTGMAGVIIVK